MTTQDTSSFFTTHQSRDVPRDQWGRYKLPGPDGTEESWTRATTFAATLAEQYGLRIWKERQVVWGLSRRPDLITMASTISGPEDKKALGEIVKEAHIAAGTDSKANRGTAIHLACASAERGAFGQVPEELRPHVSGYLTAMRDAGLEILPQYVERTGIVARYQVAGTLDNIVRCPDGKLRVCDKKTGRMDYSDTEFAVQLALYANFDALYDYGAGRYEPMPEVEKDYALLAHIDPETGHTEILRINIAWGWVWARTCAEVMDIRKTKHVITPYVPPKWEGFGSPPGFEMKVVEHVASNGDTRQTFMGTVPGGYVDSTSPMPPDFQAFWSDDRHDGDDGWDASDIDSPHAFPETVNGVPLEQYGQPSPWGCSRGKPCEFTGDDGLHSDGTVCLYGNARPDDSAIHAPTATHADLDAAAREAQQPNATPQSVMAAAGAPVGDVSTNNYVTVDPDELVAKIDGLKGGKAAVQNVARRLMAKLGIKEGDPGAIKLNQYKIKVARSCVDLAHARCVSIPGAKDGEPDFGVPSGPAPNGPASGATATAQKAKGDAGAAGVKAPDPDRDEKIKVAVESIRMQTTIAGLQERHTYYSGTSIGWTEEMQDAARTRAAEIEQEAGETPLSPLEMIQGATSRETLTKAWEKATNGGANMSGWTERLNAAALAKQTELSGGTP